MTYTKPTNADRRSLILSTALTGPTYSAQQYPNIPTEIEDVLEDAAQAYDLDFRFFHVHARNPETGLQFANLAYCTSVFNNIRSQNPGALVGGATSRKEVDRQISQQIRRIAARRCAKLSAKQL